MRDNYRFILPARASHFRSMSKTIFITKDLGRRRNSRTCHGKHGTLDASRKFWQKNIGCTGLLIGCHSFPLWPDHDHDLVALFSTLGFECEYLLHLADVELDDPSCNMNRGSCGTQERPPKNKRCLTIDIHLK
jgi:hypothetical protein